MMVDLRRSRQEGLAPRTAHTEACNLRPASPRYSHTRVPARTHTHTHIDTRTHAPTADTHTHMGRQAGALNEPRWLVHRE